VTTFDSIAASLAEALPDGDLQDLALDYHMDHLVLDGQLRAEYFDLVRGARDSAEKFLRRPPPAHVLTNILAPVIDLRHDFRKHCRGLGASDKLVNPNERLRLTLAAAGTVVAMYLENSHHED
jgi:hypothetical protein